MREKFMKTIHYRLRAFISDLYRKSDDILKLHLCNVIYSIALSSIVAKRNCRKKRR